jgi:hypothetical protein
MKRMRQKQHTVKVMKVDRYGRKKVIKMRAIIKFVPFPSGEARDREYRDWVRVYLKGEENKMKYEREHEMKN